MEWNGMNPNLMCISISIVVVIVTITIHFTQMASLGRLFARSFVRSFVCAERERERERERICCTACRERWGNIRGSGSFDHFRDNDDDDELWMDDGGHGGAS